MRKLDASWDVDVPGPGVEEDDQDEFRRVHFGIRLGRGRHQTEDTSLPVPEPTLVMPSSNSSADTWTSHP